MSDVIDFYQQQATDNSTIYPWLGVLQSEAWANLQRDGFPTRHNEEWKYTRTDALLKKAFTKSSYRAGSMTTVDLPVQQSILINNGFISGYEHCVQSLPKGVIVQPLALALENLPELVQSYLGTTLKQEHGFHFLNTAMIECGVFIYIPENVIIEKPFALIHTQDQSNNAVYLRHVIVLEKGSQATLIEDYQGNSETCYFTNSVTEITLAEDAKLTHFKIQRESKAAYHLGHVAVNQAKASEFESHSLNLGALLARSDLSIYLNGEQSHCLMNGMYVPTQGQHVDHHTTVYHQVPNCSSEQDYKGILSGASRAVFNGKVIVAKDAQHTNAKQQNKNMLLSLNAEVDTKPQLEIFADDVVCTHGATVGQLDEEALFFMATRGIDRLTATHYLIHAFTKNNLNLISNTAMADFFEQLLTQQLG